MHQPVTPLPWAASDSRSELIFADNLGMVDLSRPVAMFQKPHDAQFVLDAIEMLATLALQIEAIKKAFGAPGGYGYETACGDALYELYQSEFKIRQALGDRDGGTPS